MSENLNPKQEKAIMALLTSQTIRQAAEVAGVGETTLYRWMQEDEFCKAYKHARNQAFSQTITQIQQTANSALQTLKIIMEDEESPASSRVTAAKTVLEMSFKTYEIENVIAKVEEMERILEEREAK